MFDPLLGFARTDDTEGFKIEGKTNGKKVIVVLGNSSSDFSTSNLESWPQKISKQMPDTVVYNGAIGAYTSLQETYKLVRDVLDLNPSIIINMSGVVDAPQECKGNIKEISYLYHRLEMLVKEDADESKHNLHNLGRGILTTLNTAEFWIRNMRIMHGISQEFAIPFVAILQPCMLVGNYNYTDEEYRAIEIKRGTDEIRRIIDFYAYVREEIKKYPFIKDFSEIFSDKKDIFYDSCHWNEVGHRIIADEVIQIIKEYGI